jgi:hypothetical protein
MPTNICGATCCCWTGFDLSDCKFGVADKGECLCLTSECCLAAGEDSLGCGMVTNEDNKECCKLGLIFVACGLKSPDKLFAGVNYCLCMKSAQSFPFTKGYVEQFTCAYCCLSCAPECGCCAEAKDGKALTYPVKDYSYVNAESMSR